MDGAPLTCLRKTRKMERRAKRSFLKLKPLLSLIRTPKKIPDGGLAWVARRRTKRVENPKRIPPRLSRHLKSNLLRKRTTAGDSDWVRKAKTRKGRRARKSLQSSSRLPNQVSLVHAQCTDRILPCLNRTSCRGKSGGVGIRNLVQEKGRQIEGSRPDPSPGFR